MAAAAGGSGAGAGAGGLYHVPDGGGSVAARLQALVAVAAAAVVGPSLAASVLAIPKEAVRASQKSAASRPSACDYQCHAPVTLFRRLEAEARRAEAGGGGGGGGAAAAGASGVTGGEWAQKARRMELATSGDAFRNLIP